MTCRKRISCHVRSTPGAMKRSLISLEFLLSSFWVGDVKTEGWPILRDHVGACLRLPKRHPAWRRREAQPGSGTELENLHGDAKGKGTSAAILSSGLLMIHLQGPYDPVISVSGRQFRRSIPLAHN